ncbi:VWA domain-containing protein [Edaphobacter aggregans]|uniref:VWA domain-containing protein n=1 Tax=Edaphobacter aggregans TaxID=570835 RepID=UPI0014700CDA|nr:VWA domain-containing protein [Edaphobacter aggregans]
MAIGRVVAALSFAAVVPVVLSQQPQNQGGEVTTLRQTKQTVIVDVVVGDRYGTAVAGLKQEDFTVLQDGKPQPITFFEAHGGAPMRVGTLPKLPEGMYSNFPVPTASDAINVVLLDSLNTPLVDQGMVRREMISYLRAIPAGTKIAIFTLGSHLRMVSGFSTDPAVLLQAMRDKSVGMELSSILITPEAQQNEEKRQDQLLTTSNIGDPKSSASAEQRQAILGGINQMRQFVSDTASFSDDYRVKETLAAMDEMGRYLKQFPGRKNVIWFSASFPIGVDPDFNQTDAYRMMRDYSMDIRATTQRLAAARVAMYPIDARRFFQNPALQASSGGGSKTRNGYYRDQSMDLAFDEVTKEHDTMEQIARGTGGKAIYNTNDLKGALADVIRNGDDYYTLAYDPSGVKQDGKFHKIEVKFRQPGYSLLYRHGYVAEDASASAKAKPPGKQESSRAASLFRAEMEPGAPPASELLFRVQVLAEEKQRGAGDAPKGDNAKVVKPVTRYAFGYAAGLGNAKLIETEDGVRHGMLLSMVIAYDRQGRPLNSVLNTQTLSLDPKVYADALKTGLPFYQELDIPQQDVMIRVGVYDVGSGAMGAFEFPMSVKQVAVK